MSLHANVLWISLNAPTVRSPKAGGNTFNYYFNSFYTDNRFKIKVIAANVDANSIYPLNEDDLLLYEKRHGITGKMGRLSSIESLYNPWNRNANLISNQFETFCCKAIQLLKYDGFVPEVVILEWTQCVVMAKMIRTLLPKAKIIASEHDVTFIGYNRKQQYYKGLKKVLYSHKYKWEKKIELNALSNCDLILPHNPENIDSLAKCGINREKCLWLVPYYDKLIDCNRDSNRRDILFYGAMSRPENYLSAEWFIANVLPHLMKYNVRFVIAGSNPSDKLIKMQNEFVKVTGFVDSIKPYFESSACFVAPLVLGAGIKVKILEALSSGIPVLTNNIGIEGIPARNGIDYYHCESPTDYVQIIKKILSGEQSAQISGKMLILENYNYERFAEKYKDMILNAN